MFEKEKLEKAQEGDLKSIEEICTATWESLYRFVYFKVQNREEAEDITQETYVKALSHLEKNNIRLDKYMGFLRIVSLNVLRDKWWKKRRQGIDVNFENVNPEATALEDPTENFAQRMLLENALNNLNEEQRTVIELRIIKGYSVAETAKVMDKKEGTIRVIQYRALQALAKILNENER